MDCKSTIHRFESDRRLQISRQAYMSRIPVSVRIALVVIALMMAVSGYVWGDPVVIWQKAASVCLECIGVG